MNIKLEIINSGVGWGGKMTGGLDLDLMGGVGFGLRWGWKIWDWI